MTGTPLYQRTMARAEAGDLACEPELMHQVWDPTPWMIDVYLGDQCEGPPGHDREHDHAMHEWCRERLGDEGWPIHGHPRRWYTGGVTVDGWQWWGFDTEDAMQAFKQAWPENWRE